MEGIIVMSAAPQGHYPIEHRAGEIERLHVQAATMAPDTIVMLDRIGVAAGWRCLDLGCGPGGITGLLSDRVGSGGHVVGLDADPAFLAHAREHARGNVAFAEGNVYRSGLPDGAFDLVHVRFVAGTAGEPQALLREMIRLARPGGFVALQEPDSDTLKCHPPHPAWERLKTVMESVFESVGADVHLGQRLFALVRRAGLEDVQYRPFLVGVRASDPFNAFLPSTLESLRGTIIGRGLMSARELDAAIADCRAHLRRPETVFTTYTVVQVWGRTPTEATMSR